MAGRRRRWPGRAGRAVVGRGAIAVGIVVTLAALVSAVVAVFAVMADPGRARAPAVEPPAIVLVSAVPEEAVPGGPGDAAGVARPPIRNGRARGPAGPAALDRAVLDEALAGLAHQGVTHGRIDAVVVVRPDLARVLVETRESAAPCAPTARWREVVPSTEEDRPALVVVVGGTMRATAPFARRAGLTCRAAGAAPVILLDRRPVPGVAPAVVLLHEMGHAAGLAHDGSGDGPAPRTGRDLMATGAAAPAVPTAAPLRPPRR